VQKRFVQLVADNKKDAEFSKLLATIRRDAPIDFELPTGTWKENADPKLALDMLAEFEFRGLVPRIRSMLGVAEQEIPAEGEMPSDISGTPTPSAETLVPPEQLHNATLAVWVLDSSVTNPGFDDVLRVGKSDTFDEAYKNILAEVKKNDLEFVLHKIEEPLSPVLRRMESRGIVVDKKYLEDLSKEYHTELDAIAKRIYKAAGEEFNISSPKQLGDILFDKLGLEPEKQKKTATGQRSTRESELEKLRDQHPIIGDILSYRELSKLLGTYIDTIPTLLDQESRLHTTFIQTGTSTGRLGSENPNVQNIPIKSELGRRIRNAFVASPGTELVAFDYSQIELRIAALLSGDEELADIFRNGRDVHAEVAARVFGKDSGVEPYEQRRRAKVINFGILYGMGVNALMQTLGTNRKEAQEFYNQYFAAFPRLAAYLDEVKADASRKGYVETYFGRRRYVEGIKSSIPYVKAAAERFAINAPMQGTSADIIKLAMVTIDKFFEDTGRHGHLLLQVHDELVFEIEKDKVKEYIPKLKEMMEQVIDEKARKGIPFSAHGEVGPNWGEMVELK
jgi:DNA polymerase-1